MRVNWSELAGVSLEASERFSDSRGSFAKLYSGTEDGPISASQVCTSFNRVRGTLRGLHVQVAPRLEYKALWCTSGELFDVLVDTRRDEPTYGAWAAVDLTAIDQRMLRLPPGVAHGYQTLTDATTLTYLIDGEYDPACARTIRWDDKALGIEWPLEPSIISDSDRDGLPWPLS